ncbi:TPA: restriction endonuclease subunit S [Streptococcus suis]|nr:restriction endonuclease subunit S [Streptococcus suis]HEM4251514.1 restriction endonuclease subunit S [Streptococcus suis]
MKTNNNIPAYRFQGYTDAWELRKLGELTEKQFGGGTPTTSNDLFWEGKIPWIQSSDLEEGVFSVVPRKYITKYGLNNSSSQLIPKNSIAIVTRVGVGKIALMPFSYTTSQDFLSISHLKTNELFTVYALYIKLQNEIKVLQGTSIKGITKNELLIKEIPIPTLPEQKAIGTFFSTLDRHITLHQRKLDTLKEQKKTYLKLLFPAKGQTKPALRFQGFEDDWEEVKLGEVAKMYQPQTITGGDLIEEGIPVFGANGYIGYYSYCNHVTDQVTISARGEGTGTPNFVKAPVWITGNSMVINVDENKDIDKKFLYSNFLAYDFKKYVSGGAQPQLTRDVLSLVKISLPSLPEQEAIGTFFQTLDQEIAQVEDKLASLKEMKKTLLRKLFV